MFSDQDVAGWGVGGVKLKELVLCFYPLCVNVSWSVCGLWVVKGTSPLCFFFLFFLCCVNVS